MIGRFELRALTSEPGSVLPPREAAWLQGRQLWAPKPGQFGEQASPKLPAAEAGRRGQSSPIRVFIVDELPIVQEGLRAALSQDLDLLVVGQASSLEEAVEGIARSKPDIVLTDIVLGGHDPVEVIEQLGSAAAGAKLLILTLAPLEQVRTALAHGGHGCMSKRASAEHIAATVASLAKGEYVFPALGSRRWEGAGAEVGSAGALSRLTDRELMVLQFLAKGLTNQEIAQQLRVSQNTVRFHVHRILDKLGCHNRTEAVAVAMASRLLSRSEGPPRNGSSGGEVGDEW